MQAQLAALASQAAVSQGGYEQGTVWGGDGAAARAGGDGGDGGTVGMQDTAALEALMSLPEAKQEGATLPQGGRAAGARGVRCAVSVELLGRVASL